MKLNLLSAIPSMNHCRPNTGLGRAIALFLRGFMPEGLYQLESGKSISESLSSKNILESLVGWTNPDQRRFLTQSGRCRFNLSLT